MQFTVLSMTLFYYCQRTVHRVYKVWGSKEIMARNFFPGCSEGHSGECKLQKIELMNESTDSCFKGCSPLPNQRAPKSTAGDWCSNQFGST